MLTNIAGGRVIDPANDRDAIGDVWVEGGRIVAAPDGRSADAIIDAAGMVVMAGAIDVHSHIAGGNVMLSRLLLPELHINEGGDPDTAFGNARGSGTEIGRLYACMGFTTVIEPALPPTAALATHLELEDVPFLDRGALTVMGNDDQLLALLRDREGTGAVRDLVAQTLALSRGVGLKVVNAGGAAAFKENVRTFDLDDEVPSYGLTSRQILSSLFDARDALGVPHPLHVHCNNLGAPDAYKTVVETMRTAEGRPAHFAHAQFYGYASRADGGLESAAERICAALAEHPNVTLDVGQVAFGPTCTISLDISRQFSARNLADPKKWIIVDGDAEGGGLVPFNYRCRNGFNAFQFAVGLELFLRSPDPWRTLLTTDHPNGGPFTAYPRIMHLLMDKEERDRELASLPKMARERTTLGTINREYTLNEIAIMTRAAPARLLGLTDRGHLAPGANADVAVYADREDRTAMFGSASHVLKDGELIVRDGAVVASKRGRTIALSPDRDSAMEQRSDAYLENRFGRGLESFSVPDAAFGDRAVFDLRACRA